MFALIEFVEKEEGRLYPDTQEISLPGVPHVGDWFTFNDEDFRVVTVDWIYDDMVDGPYGARVASYTPRLKLK